MMSPYTQAGGTDKDFVKNLAVDDSDAIVAVGTGRSTRTFGEGTGR